MTTLIRQQPIVCCCHSKTKYEDNSKQDGNVQFIFWGIRPELGSQQEKLTNSLKLEREMVYLLGIRMEPEIQQEELKQEKLNREERSRIQAIHSLITSLQLDRQQKELKDNLEEEKVTGESRSNDQNIIWSTKTELESQQEKLTNSLKQDREKGYWEEISRIQFIFWGIRPELGSQQEKLTNGLKLERRKVNREERSRIQCILWGIRPELESQQEKLTNSLKLERKKVNREERSRIQTGPLPRTAEIKDAICLLNKSGEQTYRRAENFQSSKIITKDGGVLEIKETGVSLLVPPGALLEDREISIQIITGNLDTGDDVTFASNAAAIVELTPDNFEFQTAVELQLPHCLQLKENFTNESVEVFSSHHDPKDQPRWERETEVKFELQKETVKLYLKKFCWVTLRVNNEVVKAKRLMIFTVGEKVKDTDSEFTVHVGYFADVPGNGHIFKDGNITIGQYKPFWFKKQEQTPLVIFLNDLKPTEWTHTADGRQKEITYQDIASSKNRSCEFVLSCIRSVRRSGVPYSTFTVYRQHDSTSISFRPKIWDDVSEDEEL